MALEKVFNCKIPGCGGKTIFRLTDMSLNGKNFVVCEKCNTKWYATIRSSCCRTTVTFKASNPRTSAPIVASQSFKR